MKDLIFHLAGITVMVCVYVQVKFWYFTVILSAIIDLVEF